MNEIATVMVNRDIIRTCVHHVYEAARVRGISEHLLRVMEFLAYGASSWGRRLAYCVLRENSYKIRLYQYVENLVFNYDIVFSHCYDSVFSIFEDDIIVDAGAHVGVFTVYAALRASKGLVLSFEPHPINFKLLQLNVKLNKLTNVILFNKALSSSTGTTKMFLHTKPGGHSIILRRTERYIYVPVTTLDSAFNELGLEPERLFLKINAEGSEPHIIKGAMSTLRKVRDCRVVASCDHYREEMHAVTELLAKLGFKRIYYDRKRHIIYASKSL